MARLIFLIKSLPLNRKWIETFNFVVIKFSLISTSLPLSKIFYFNTAPPSTKCPLQTKPQRVKCQFFSFGKCQKSLKYLSLSQINIWRSNSLWLCKTAMLFTLPESGAQSKESEVFAIVGTFLFVILLWPFIFFL
jgi:hypothetical protein